MHGLPNLKIHFHIHVFFSFGASKWTLSYGVHLQNGANASISLMRASRSDGNNLLSTAPETLLRQDQK